MNYNMISMGGEAAPLKRPVKEEPILSTDNPRSNLVDLLTNQNKRDLRVVKTALRREIALLESEQEMLSIEETITQIYSLIEELEASLDRVTSTFNPESHREVMVLKKMIRKVISGLEGFKEQYRLIESSFRGAAGSSGHPETVFHALEALNLPVSVKEKISDLLGKDLVPGTHSRTDNLSRLLANRQQTWHYILNLLKEVS